MILCIYIPTYLRKIIFQLIKKNIFLCHNPKQRYSYIHNVSQIAETIQRNHSVQLNNGKRDREKFGKARRREETEKCGKTESESQRIKIR